MNHLKLVSNHYYLIIILMCFSVLIACSNDQTQATGVQPTLLETEIHSLISEHMETNARTDTFRYLRGVKFPTTSWDGVGTWQVKATSYGGIGCEFTIHESSKLIEEKEGCSLMKVLRGAAQRPD